MMNRIKAASLALFVLAWSAPSPAQNGPVGVFDQAGLFSSDAIQQVEQTLQGLRDQTGWQVAIQTIDALNGQDIQTRALAGANKVKVHGLYILISRADHKFRIIPSQGAEAAFPESKVRAVTDALTAGFKQNAFDQGLLDAVAEIKLGAVAAPKPSAKGANTVSVRDQAGLFSAETIRQVEQTLREVYLNNGWQVIIQTIDSLDGQDVKKRALEDAKTSQVHGLYFLISKNDQKFRIVPSESARRVFPQEMITGLSSALTKDFKQGRFDQGLLDAVAKVKTAAAAKPSAAAPALVESRSADEVPDAPPAPEANRDGSAKVGNHGRNELLILGVGAVVVLLVLGKVFRRRQSYTGQPDPGYAPTGFLPVERPGYRPQPDNLGPPPPQGGGGGGFMSGMLGGLGGAVVGNILYDKFGRPHPASTQGGEGPHAEHGVPEAPIIPPASDDPADPLPPVETYQPDSGGGGDWSEPAAPETGGDWGGDEPSGGDWGEDGGEGGGGEW